MEYRILTNDLWVDENGKNQAFMHIEINTGTDIWTKAERLPAAEVAQLVADPSSVNTIALNMANRAVILRVQEKIDEENNRQLELERIKLEQIKAQIELESLKG